LSRARLLTIVSCIAAAGEGSFRITEQKTTGDATYESNWSTVTFQVR
jgi:hypothetical protein